jgi:hypothetical protein
MAWKKGFKDWHEATRFARRQAVAILESVQNAEDALARTDEQGCEDHLIVAMEDAESLVQRLEIGIETDEQRARRKRKVR